MAICFFCLAAPWMEAHRSEAAESLYVVEAEAALLRDFPSPESGILARLQRSDQVEFLDAQASGWWKVRSLRTGVVGWMTSDLLVAAPLQLPPTSSTKVDYFYVNTPGDLRIIPLHSSASTGKVQRHDRVEKLGSSPEGWTKVRNPRDGRQGWLPTRHLSAKLVAAPGTAAPTARKRVRRAVPSKKKPTIEKPVAIPEIPKPM